MTKKARRRRLIVKIVELLIGAVGIWLMLLIMLWAIGYFVEQAAPVLSRAMWAAYHEIMG